MNTPPPTGWASIDTAPKDGTHILACNAQTPYGPHWGFNQRPPMIVHYWANPGEEGFYLSQNSGDVPMNLTHWQPLPTPPSATPKAAPASWWDEAKRIIVYRIGIWCERRAKPDTLPGMTAAEVKAYYLGRQREAEAMIDLLSAINRGEDTTWAAPSSPNDLDETRPRTKDGC